jgi:predicted nucleic acid-binding Zn ribbon protein
MHAQPVRVADGCLDLAGDGGAWQRQLQAMKQELCGRINRAWGAKLVDEVRFVARGPRPSREADSQHTPFIRRRA